MKISRNPETVHKPIASYTHQIEVTGQQRWLILSGQVGMEPDGTLPEGSIEQFEAALRNISSNLRAGDMKVRDIVKLTLFLASPMDNEKRREVLSNWLVGHQPCMTLIYVAALASPDLKVEIDVMACVDSIDSGEV